MVMQRDVGSVLLLRAVPATEMFTLQYIWPVFIPHRTSTAPPIPAGMTILLWREVVTFHGGRVQAFAQLGNIGMVPRVSRPAEARPRRGMKETKGPPECGSRGASGDHLTTAQPVRRDGDLNSNSDF